MRLGEALFHLDSKVFEVVETDFGERHYLDWEIAPLAGPTLAREYTLSGLAEGHFILEGLVVQTDGRTEKAYLDVVLPERVIESHYRLTDEEIMNARGTRISDAKIIPAVAIEKSGPYVQYYVKGHPEVGLKVLREGLAAANLKWPIALDMAYILRDESQYSEAVEAFTLAISEIDGVSYFYYSERAQLFTRLNNQGAADQDWDQVKRMAGTEVLKNMRGF